MTCKNFLCCSIDERCPCRRAKKLDTIPDISVQELDFALCQERRSRYGVLFTDDAIKWLEEVDPDDLSPQTAIAVGYRIAMARIKGTTETERCEGCQTILSDNDCHYDSEGVPLCGECYAELLQSEEV